MPPGSFRRRSLPGSPGWLIPAGLRAVTLARVLAWIVVLVLVSALSSTGCAPATPSAGPPGEPQVGPRSVAVPVAPWRAGDLLILDADAGVALPGAERAGVLFLCRATDDGGYGTPEMLVSDSRWREPTDFLVLPDGTLLVVESVWEPDPDRGQEHGALFRVAPSSPPEVTLWWTDDRLRRPVSLARDSAGTVFVSDRDADPLGLGAATGCVLAVSRLSGSADVPGGLGLAGPARVLASGPQLVTPGPLVLAPDGALLLMDADANPRKVLFDDGRWGTPGVLYRVAPGPLTVELEPTRTVSPIGLILDDDGTLYVVDANKGQRHGVMGDGAVFRRSGDGLELVVDSWLLGRARALVDPCGGDSLVDGRLLIADANADPLGLGEDGTGKGVYGTGPGAVLIVDPAAATVDTFIADERFVMPLAVRRVRH